MLNLSYRKTLPGITEYTTLVCSTVVHDPATSADALGMTQLALYCLTHY